jgi:hypothetical protein
MRKHILFRYFAQATGADRNMISAPISRILHSSDNTTLRLSVLDDITGIYAHAAAYKIIEIRSSNAGLLKTAEGSNDEL